MQVVDTVSALKAQVKAWRREDKTVAFVPTMGNLHQGHLSLVKKAKEWADKVVVSVFVNPMQFDDQSDLSAYPRTVQQDIEQLTSIECDLVFTPTPEMMYPNGMDNQSKVSVPGSDDKLCGLAREGHFDGVATVVTKLFNLVQADFAVFGEKDYQQLMMIKKMVHDLNIPIEIVQGATFREASGLAMSSRNQYLTEEEKAQAAGLYQVLCETDKQLQAGERDFLSVQQQAIESLERLGFQPDYVDIRSADTLASAKIGDTSLRILAAAKLGKARLIDNIACNLA
jgi:pantoate--beta-alanine ligase